MENLELKWILLIVVFIAIFLFAGPNCKNGKCKK